MVTALLCALVHQLCYVLDNFTSTQCFTRPIIIGTLTGLLTGDIKTGIIMGAELEAINMGINAIGGVAATDYRVSTILAVALVTTTGAPQEVGLSLAVPIGALINATKPISKAIRALYHPVYTKLEEEGKYKAFQVLYVLDGLLIKNLFETLIVFLCMALGTDLLTNAINVIPSFIMNGLDVASGVLVVVGLSLISISIWGTYTPVYILIGFILSKFLGLTTTVIAMIGFIIAILQFKTSKEMRDLSHSDLTHAADNGEGDDFYD